MNSGTMDKTSDDEIIGKVMFRSNIVMQYYHD